MVVMALEAIFEYRNADQTGLLNDRFRTLFGKGIFDGGIVTAVPLSLSIDVSAFSAIGFDGMMVRNTSPQRLVVQSDEENYLVVRAIHKETTDAILQYEVLTKADYDSDGQKDFLILFAVVDLLGGAAEVLPPDIETVLRDTLTPLGRSNFRGTITQVLLLPLLNNLPEDWYFIDDGSGTASPELHVWNGTSWIDISGNTTAVDLNQHRNNNFDDEKHLTNLQADAASGSADTLSITGITRSGSIGTVTTTVDHELGDGETVVLSGADQIEYNGTFNISGATGSIFTISITGTPATPATGTLFFKVSPSQINRYVVESDTTLPTQDENDAFVGTSGSPGTANPFVTSLQPIAIPTETVFAVSPSPQNQVPLLDANGPYYVGTTVLKGHIQFGLFSFDENTRGVYQNSGALNVLPLAMFLDDGITPFDPSTDGGVDSDGFHSGKDLVLRVDNNIDTSFRLSYGKRTTIGQLNVASRIERGPRSYPSNTDAALSGQAAVAGAHLHPNDTVTLFQFADATPYFDARDKFSPVINTNVVTPFDNRFKSGVAVQENSAQFLTDINDFSDQAGPATEWDHSLITSVEATTGDTLDVFENVDANKITVSATTGEIFKTAISASLTVAARTFSMYFKAGTADEVGLRIAYAGGTPQDAKVNYNLTTLSVTTEFDGSDAPTASGIDYAGRGWYRCWLSLTSNVSDNQMIVGIFPSRDETTGFSYVNWGQVEQRTYPSTFMEEVSTRSDAQLSYDSSILPHRGVISFWAKRSDLLYDSTRSILFLNGNLSVGVAILASDDNIQYVNSSGTWTSTSTPWSDRNWHRIGYDYGQGILYFDNVKIVDASTAVAVPDHTFDINVGSTNTPDGWFNGVITELLTESSQINDDVQQGRQTLGLAGKRLFLPPTIRDFSRWSKGNRAILKEFYDVVVGRPEDIVAGVADVKIEDFGTTTFEAGDRVWFMAGVHPQTQNEAIEDNDVRFDFDPDAIIDAGANRSFTLQGDRIVMNGARFQNYTQGKIVLSGDAVHVVALEGALDIFTVTGAGSLVTSTNSGLKTATWNIDSATGIGTFGSLGSANLQERSEKDLAGGYAGLDNSILLADSQISTNIERSANKSVADGYAGLNSSAVLNDAEIPDTLERKDRKAQPNGYASLDTGSNIVQNVNVSKITGLLGVPQGGTGVGSQESQKVVVTDDSGNLVAGTSPTNPAQNVTSTHVSQLEGISSSTTIQFQLNDKQSTGQRNTPNGYAGLDINTLLNLSQIPQLTAAQLAINSVGASEIASFAVHRTELSTSLFTAGSAENQLVAFNPGTYGFAPEIRFKGGWYTLNQTKFFPDSTNAYRVYFYVAATIGGLGIRLRGVNSSPPYDLGYGEVPLFIYLILDSTTRKVVTSYTASEPPWGGVQTCIDADRYGKDGKAYRMQKTLPPRDGLPLDEWLSLVADIPAKEVEITTQMKNVDMPLAPHPFQEQKSNRQIVFLDPQADCMTKLKDMYDDVEKQGPLYDSQDDWTDLFQYLDLDLTTDMDRGLCNVKTVGVKWKNTKLR